MMTWPTHPSRTLRLLVLLLALLLIALLALPVAGQGAVETTLTAVPAEATVGDPIAITLSVNHPAGYFVIVPQLEQQWGDFTIAGQSPATTTDNGDGSETTSVTYDARLFAPGVFATPPLVYTVTDGTGNLYEFTAQPVGVTVNTVLVEGDADLRDIKPQAEIPTATWLALLGIGLALAAVAAGVVWFSRRRKVAPAAPDTRTPYQRALDDLAEVDGLQLPAAGRFNEYYTLVSEGVRRYMGATYHIPVLERTTAEIQHDLRTAAVDPALRDQFVTFLQESDLVKFANFRPSLEDAAQLSAEARRIVEANHAATAQFPNGEGEGSGGPIPATTPAPSANGQDQPEEVSA